MATTDALYHEVAEIIRSVLAKEQGVRTAVYRSEYKNKKSLLKLTCETLKFKSVWDEILRDPDLRSVMTDPEIKGNVHLAYVLLHDFLAGPGLSRVSPKLKAPFLRKEQAIKDQERILKEAGRGIQAVRSQEEKTAKTKVVIPRYARINTLKWTREEALDTLRSESWQIVSLEEGEVFADRVAKLKYEEVLIDPHVDNLLCLFPNMNDFHTYWMVEQRYLILQDKASCLPAFLLNPPVGSDVIDACAAPGMKTSHVAAIMNNTGNIFAMDRVADRVETMKTLLEDGGVKCVTVSNADFLQCNFRDKMYSKVKYAIVDPPCSGSGIIKRMDELTGGTRETGRLEKLQNLQAMILKHALKFPALERAVYSTCSIHEEENEQVIDEVLRDTYVRKHFRLAPGVLPSWTHRGLSKYPDIGEHCIRADPSVTLTNGFFVAVFERITVAQEEEAVPVQPVQQQYADEEDEDDDIEDEEVSDISDSDSDDAE